MILYDYDHHRCVDYYSGVLGQLHRGVLVVRESV